MPGHRLLVAALATAATGSGPRIASAQMATAIGVSRNACLDAIPDSALHRVPVYLAPNPIDSAGPRMPLRDGIDLLTQAVAQTGRSLLGAAEGMLPAGEPALGWRVLDGDVLVVARRNGTMSARVVPPRHAGDAWMGDAGARFVARALDTAWARGERVFFPDSVPIDSVSWLFHLESAVVNEAGEFSAPKMRMGIPMFSVLAPTERQVAAERVRVAYPPRLRKAGFMGHVLMEFVVDTAGHVDGSTIRDLYPSGAPPLSGANLDAYNEFIHSIRQALERARYRPANIGGCSVRQLVQQPFTFSLGDGLPPRP